MSNDDPKLTELLNRWFGGDRTVEEELWPYLVRELRVIAKARLKLERPDHTLKATELVNELYLKLEHRASLRFPSRGHFFKLSKIALRLFFIDYEKVRARHPEGQPKTTIDPTIPVAGPGVLVDLVDVLDLLDQLALPDERAATAIVLFYFYGRSLVEIAEELRVSTKTAKRDIDFGLAWMRARANSRSTK